MSNRKKFSDEEIKNIGFRIKACRMLTGLTQEEFGNKYGIPSPSIKTWEFGGVIPRIEGLKKFSDCLRAVGIFVSSDWLLHATGTGPTYLSDQQYEDSSQIDESSSDEISSFKEMFERTCKKNKNNPIIFEVKDDEMFPLFNAGDLIAGVLVDRAEFKYQPKKPMLVKLDSGNYAPRYLHLVGEEFFICSIKNPHINKIKLNSFGLICWHKSC